MQHDDDRDFFHERIMLIHAPTAYFTTDPADEDVLLGRGKRNQQHPGNISFIQKIDECVALYHENERGKKQETVNMIMEWLANRNGNFVKKSPEGYWVEVSESVAKDKIAQAFRHRNPFRNAAPQESRTEPGDPPPESTPKDNTTDTRSSNNSNLVQQSCIGDVAAKQQQKNSSVKKQPLNRSFDPVEPAHLESLSWKEETAIAGPADQHPSQERVHKSTNDEEEEEDRSSQKKPRVLK